MIKTERMLSDGTYSTAPKLGWVKLIDENGEIHDSRTYGVLKKTPRASFSSASGSMVQIPCRSEPYFTQNIMRQPKSIEVTIGITDERIAEDVLQAFCRSGKLIISTHPNLYYKAHIADPVASEGITRNFSEITIVYTASAFRYLLDEPIAETGAGADDGVLAEGITNIFMEPPFSEETSEPKIYIQTQKNALANTLAFEVSADSGSVFRCENLAPGTVYCIDSELLTFYRCGYIDTEGKFVKEVFTDMTGKTSGDFPTFKAQKKHELSYKGYIRNMWVLPNRRWNI